VTRTLLGSALRPLPAANARVAIGVTYLAWFVTLVSIFDMMWSSEFIVIALISK